MSWSAYEHENGVGRFTYEKDDGTTRIDERSEPTGPEHDGWDAKKVLATRPIAEMTKDQNFLNRSRYAA